MSADASRSMQNQRPEDPKRSKMGRHVRAWLRRAFLDNAGIKFVSLVLAVTLFILVNTGQDVTIRLDVGVAYTMPEDRVLISEPVDRVTIGVRGSWRQTRRFDERQLERVHVDLRDRQDGIFEFSDGDFRLPHGLKLESITPRAMRLTFEARASRTVPVRVELVGNPAEGFRASRAEARPSNVVIRGGKSKVDKVEFVETLGVSLAERKESFEDIVALAVPSGLSVDGANHVQVTVRMTEALERRVLEAVPVAVRSTDPTRPVAELYEVGPATVQVVLLGSHSAIENVLREPLFPYVTIAPDEAGGRVVEVMLGAAGVGHEIRPPRVTVVKR